MLILVSGEGVTDMGRCLVADSCCGDEFEAGPMAWLVDQVVEAALEYALLPLGLMYFVSKARLSAVSKARRTVTLVGKKRPLETGYFYFNARAMAHLAKELATDMDDEVVAVLFRDADRTQSTAEVEWHNKRESMLNGFAYEGFDKGVPMVPNPKSEAWLLCALKKQQPYQHCDGIELASGNDRAPNSLKAQLAAALGEEPSAAALADLVRTGAVDASRIDMTSFNAFKTRLEDCLCPWKNMAAGG